ncbi:hypothetical protein RJ640_017023 [Escallonia rubra]|uniref:Uncharacterized protein n=1 Tax=Escallonia rubra TaxID=112253 RepID=A0AA88U9F5_9ASTE|nr:hypothetical protein RJ640_017023 [Escallonia rubra]
MLGLGFSKDGRTSCLWKCTLRAIKIQWKAVVVSFGSTLATLRTILLLYYWKVFTLHLIASHFSTYIKHVKCNFWDMVLVVSW